MKRIRRIATTGVLTALLLAVPAMAAQDSQVDKRKAAVLKSLLERELLTPALKAGVDGAATLAALAAQRGATPAQLAIAWVLTKGPHIVPLVGARTRKQLDESLGALDVVLSDEDVARLEAAISPAAVAGTRYDERQMRVLDSER